MLQAGPSYGRRTLTGLLRSQGVVVGEQRVRSAMATVTPAYVEKRPTTAYHQINPTPYYAEYFGHKIHIVQNEKLTRFGVTHFAASDGYSGKLLGVVSMPTKNNTAIYTDLFRRVRCSIMLPSHLTRPHSLMHFNSSNAYASVCD